jgi:hypothetical protein
LVRPGPPGLSGFSPCSELSRRAMLLEAVPAVYRPALGGPERYLAFLLALGACRLVHFPGATKAPATPVPVSVSHVLTLYCSDIALGESSPPAREILSENPNFRTIFPDGPVWMLINLLVSNTSPRCPTGVRRAGPARGANHGSRIYSTSRFLHLGSK